MPEKYGNKSEITESRDAGNNNLESTSNLGIESMTEKKVTLSQVAIKGIDFGYTANQQKNESLMSHLNKIADGNNTPEGWLAQNEQIQLFLSEVLSDYERNKGKNSENLKHLMAQERNIIENSSKQEYKNDFKMIDSLYQFMQQYIQDNPTSFADFIGIHGINNINNYLGNHVKGDGENQKFYISKNELKSRLKIDWFLYLYGEYLDTYKPENEEDSQILNYLDKKKSGLLSAFKTVKNSIDIHIQNYFDGDGKNDKAKLAENLQKFLSQTQEYAQNNEYLKDFIGNTDLHNSMMLLIRYGIKEYASVLNISGNNFQLKDTGDPVFDIQIRSYLYLYGILAYGNNNQSNDINFNPKNGLDDKELSEVLKAILVTDGLIENDGSSKYLATEQNLNKTRVEKDVIRRREARMKINTTRIKGSGSEGFGLANEKKNSLDIQNATGVEISQDKKLGSQILGFNRKNSLNTIENQQLQKGVLIETSKAFVKENREILSTFLDINDITKFFVIGNDVNFNDDEWENFRNKRITDHNGEYSSKLDELKTILLSFPNKYEENLKKAGIFVNEKMDEAHETIKNYAIGAIIDNIKDMFQTIIDTNNTGKFMNGFEFNEDNAAKISNNCLLLSGKFNGETMNIKYDLNTGKLYMNSFINETANKITITGSTEPKYEIGELKPFNDVLDDFYKFPTESMNSGSISRIKGHLSSDKNRNTQGGIQQEQTATKYAMPRLSDIRDKIKQEHKIKFQKMCGTKLNEIGGKIKDKVETKSTCEPIALDLLNSLGINIDNSGTTDLIGGDNPSDLYKILHLIINEKNTESINNFSEYMKTFMEIIGLSRGENIDHQDKTKDNSRIIFNQNNKQKYITYVRENTQDFDKEYLSTKGIAQFDKKSNFGILKIIEEKFTEGEYPNRRFDNQKIHDFKKMLNSDISDAHYKETAELVEKNEVAEAEALIKNIDNIA